MSAYVFPSINSRNGPARPSAAGRMSANLFAVSAEQAVEAMDAVGGPHAAISGGVRI